MAAIDLSGFPDDMLVLLAERQPSLADSLRFGAVCRSWASAAGQKQPGAYLPYLLVPDRDGDRGGGGSSNGRPCNLFCVSSQKVYRGLSFPEDALSWRYFGSSHAWLAMVDLDANACLLNPMSGVRVELPALTTFPDVVDVVHWPPQGKREGGGGGHDGASCGDAGRRHKLYVFDWFKADDDTPADEVVDGLVPCGLNGKEMRDLYMFKMCMSSSKPDSDPNCVVMVIYSGMNQLGYCKPGDSEWTPLETPWRPFQDVTFHRGKFYVANDQGAVVVVDSIVDDGLGFLAAVRQVAPSPQPHLTGRKYLVGLPSGEMLLVVRDRNTETNPYRTVGFLLFKIDISSSWWPKWQKVNSLGELTLFLGHSSSIAISSFQASGACRGNCIYFTDDNLEGYYGEPFGGHDMGVFDIETKSIERHYASDSQLIMPPPIWITPNPK